jgi:hypothetical protein
VLSSPRVRVLASLALVVTAMAAFLGGRITDGASAIRAKPDKPNAHTVRPAPRPRVAVYGDSLSVQADPYLLALGKVFGLTVKVHAFSGTAPCDFLPILRTDLDTHRPDLVLFAFSGNSIATCMLDASGKPLVGFAVLAKYRTDTEAAIDATLGAHLPFLLASPPAPVGKSDNWKQFDDLYRSIAAAHPGVQYVDAGQDIAPGGQFVATQQCLPFEVNLPQARNICRSPDARINVRGPDGAHFCGNASLTAAAGCSMYSSGALRYAINLVDAARLTLDYLQHSPTTGPSAPPPQRN